MQMLAATGVSDPGCVRSNNEDYFLLAPSLGLYLLADGMGGAQAGEHASRLAAESVAEFVWQEGANSGPTPEILVDAIKAANQRLLDEASADPSLHGMGTTLVAALILGDVLHIVSVGDSRAYVVQNRELRAVTEDQTWVNEIGRRLGIEEAALRVHPMRHVLTMAVGVNGQVRMNHYQLRLTPDTQVLLSSDGLHSVVEEPDIAAVLTRDLSREEKCRLLIDAARNAGGPDNITVVLLTPEA